MNHYLNYSYDNHDRRLHYYDYTPEAGATRIVFFGGYRSDMAGRKAQFLAQLARDHHMACTLFEYQGHGASSGSDFTALGLSDWLADCLAVVDSLSSGPRIFVGSSLGAWLMLLTAKRRPHHLERMIALAPAVDFTERLIRPSLSATETAQLAQQGWIDRDPEREGFALYSRKLFDDGAQYQLLGDGYLDIPTDMDVVHGMEDPTVPYQEALRLIQACRGRSAVAHIINDADHRLSRPEDLARIKYLLV